MQKRYQFMECFGMRQTERVRTERREVSRFLWIPLLLSAVFVPVFTGIVFRLREFDAGEIRAYLLCWAGLAAIYLAVQLLNLKILEYDVTKKVEETIRKERPLQAKNDR